MPPRAGRFLLRKGQGGPEREGDIMRKNDFIFATGLFVLLGILVFLVFFDNAARAAVRPIVSVYGG